MTIVKPITLRDIYHSTVVRIPELAFLSRDTLARALDGIAQKLWTLVVCPAMCAYSALVARVRGCKEVFIEAVPVLPPASFLLQSLWTLTHVSTLLSTIAYFHYRWGLDVVGARYCYFLTGLSMFVTYCLVTYRHSVLLLASKKQAALKPNSTSDNMLRTLLKSENTFLLIMSVLVLLSQQNGLKLVSFFIYSSMNMVSHVLFEWFPDDSLSAAITPLFSYFEETLLLIAAASDGLVNCIYFYECTFTDSKCQFVIYLTVFMLRLESSEICREAVGLLIYVSGWCCALGMKTIKREINPVEKTDITVLAPVPQLGPELSRIGEGFSQPKLRPPSSFGVRDISTSDYSNLRKRDRIASLVFDSFSVVNDLIQ